MQALGALLLVAGTAVGAIGGLWTTFAIVGAEWDYCPGGGDCIPGELMGMLLLAVAGLAAWIGLRLVRTR